MFNRFTLLCAVACFALSFSPSRADTASDIASLKATVASLQAQVNALKSVTSGFSRVTDTTRTDGKKGTELYLTGFNLHVVNGLGATDGDPKDTGTTAVNGLGNVIIGYNALRGSGNDLRTGSHTLVVGDYQNYSSYGGIVAGDYNTLKGPFASITGGLYGMASNFCAHISGGSSNVASGPYASILGGYGSTASGMYATIGGGRNNTASGEDASVSGGETRTASGDDNWAAGGYFQAH